VMKTITLNSRRYEIRENLFDALVHLRHETRERVLWIDAICINQDDVEERNHQVSQMGAIYSKASKVVAWVGLADEFTTAALGYLQEFEAVPDLIDRTSFDIFKTKLAGTVDGHRVLEGVRSVSLRPYWTRLWIIQEVNLASDAHIQCGSDCISWQVFKDFVISSQSNDPDYPVAGGFQKKFGQREDPMSNLLWFHWENEDYGYLSFLCYMFNESQCEKAIDKVFGLRALAPICCQEAVPVDYGLAI